MISLKSIEKLRTIARNMAKSLNLKNHEECNLLLITADEIEREIAERFIDLPVDADGVPIRVGDEMENSEYRGKVTEMCWDGHFWHVYHGSIAIAPCDYTHVKPRTVEDVLVEFYGEFAKAKYGEDSEVLSHYADELARVLMGGDER